MMVQESVLTINYKSFRFRAMHAIAGCWLDGRWMGWTIDDGWFG